MSQRLETYSPVDGKLLVERPLADDRAIAAALEAARAAQAGWRDTPVAERAALCSALVNAFVSRRDELAEEITRQMGRPLRHSPGEIVGFEERARHMIAIAEASLAEVQVAPKAGFTRFIRRVPWGVVLTVAPWNYPYLTAVNSVVPALMAGNAVLIRHSSQTPLCSERIVEAGHDAGLPAGVLQYLHTGHRETARLLSEGAVDFVAFTGSVEGGRAMQRAAAERFLGVGLELGGKDPAYVRADADLEPSVEGIVDGAFYNAGQSCCGIERVYVHADRFDEFVDAAVALVKRYRLGNPLDPDVDLGPLVRTSAADHVRGQVREAVAAGARALIDPGAFEADAEGTPYLAPQVLVDVDHSMRVMTEESFGPVVGIMPVRDDDEAVARMNDSDFGLSASVWTRDEEAALALGARVETGTWFMNRCDYLDPALAWTGVKDTGRGCTLSQLGYEALTRPQSFHLRHAP